VIDHISTYQITIASAVEEQTATTNEMARNVAQAATGAGDIAGTITLMAAASQTTAAGVGEASAAIGDLAQMAGQLRQLVQRFTYVTQA